MKIIRYGLMLVGAVILLLALFIVKTLWVAGEFKDLIPHETGQYKSVSSLAGAEDITVDPSTGTAFISCNDRRAAMRGEKKQGAIYAYDLKAANPAPVSITESVRFRFHPHGISFFAAPNGKKMLFVVNMGHDAHFHDSSQNGTIEIFEYSGSRLIHRQTIADSKLHSPNDILGVGEKQFYVTNDHGATSRLGKMAEDYLQLSWAHVLYYDGSGFSKAAEDLSYANGIATSPDGSAVYVTSTVKGYLRIFSRDPSTGVLSRQEDIQLGTGLDNIEVDETGSLWIGCHPKLLTFVKHSKDPAVRSPSQVLRVRIGENKVHEIEEIYLNDGVALSGSSVAMRYRNRLLIGSVYEHFLDGVLPEKFDAS
ncbi:MAG: strictosidine synthase family protein [Desulfobacterales bacterium]|nr:strictosidine synthase family protein [Desulfobacterales bacterium]